MNGILKLLYLAFYYFPWVRTQATYQDRPYNFSTKRLDLYTTLWQRKEKPK